MAAAACLRAKRTHEHPALTTPCRPPKQGEAEEFAAYGVLLAAGTGDANALAHEMHAAAATPGALRPPCFGLLRPPMPWTARCLRREE